MKQVIHFLPVVLVTSFIAFCFYRPAGAMDHENNYQTYSNARFAYSISYPSNLLIPQGESDNGDGQKFQSKDGHAIMLVYGSNNVLGQTIKQLYAEASRGGASDHPKRSITYKILKGDWYVISGNENGRVFYQKTMLRRDAIKTFSIEYGEAQKGIFNPVTTKIAMSFKAL